MGNSEVKRDEDQAWTSSKDSHSKTKIDHGISVSKRCHLRLPSAAVEGPCGLKSLNQWKVHT